MMVLNHSSLHSTNHCVVIFKRKMYTLRLLSQGQGCCAM